ncbi:MAG: hypothetical protein AAB381_02995 [Patescibacteria group bacterium]
MIKDSDIVTKRYLTKELNSFRTEMKEQKIEIIREIRIMMHETMDGAMENMKLYHQEENNRHVGAVIEGMKDDNRGIRDGIKMVEGRVDDHENRLQAAGI